MPKVHHVKKARKDNQVCKAGESYYWWKFNYGSKRYSLTYPKRSQLTQSGFLGALYDLEDSIPAELSEDDADSLVSDLEALSEECQDSLDNMPQHLQDTSSSGELLQERIDSLDQWAGEIQGIDWESVTPGEASEIVSSANPGIG